MAIVKFKGPDGKWYTIPARGPKGADGRDGASAYELAVAQGYTGTLEEWVQAYYAGRRNLLINWDFRNPVNQRAIVSGSALNASGYWLDRWQYDTKSIMWTQGVGVTMAAGAAIWQYMELPHTDMLGEKVTVSMGLADGTVQTATGHYPDGFASGQEALNVVDTASCTITLGFTYRSAGVMICGMARHYMPYLTIKSKTDVTIQTVKLEYGAVSTLAQDPPMDYGAELGKCRRYLRVYHYEHDTTTTTYYLIATGVATNSGYLIVPFMDIWQMRMSPSVVTRTGIRCGTSALTMTPVGVWTSGRSLVLTSSNGFVAGNAYEVGLVNGDFILSAEL